MPIYEQRLQEDALQIRKAVAAMGADVESSIRHAVQALLTGNEPLANQTVLRDYQIDRQCRYIDRICHNFIARHLPSASHLRLISSSLRMIYDLERMADYAVNISRETLDLPTAPTGLLQHKIETMTNNSCTMLRQVMTAYMEENAGLARSTIEMNEQVSRELGNVFNDLVHEGDDHVGHSREILDLYIIFNMLERVGNRATNLCEEVIFWLTGEVVKEERINILFLDEDNTILGPMAEAIAQKGYAGKCHFSSASRLPASNVNPQLVQFMRSVGFDLSKLQPKGIETIDINRVDILISLQGPVRSYVEKPPFHTAFLDWDVGGGRENMEGPASQARLELIYREINLQLRQLMELVACQENY
ncbi:MAG: phosphate signaling complex protein PhoU [Magnetococcales bacterium]|nr:phosphate signaling complex protein PhoU [Magnetococcales bacterium]